MAGTSKTRVWTSACGRVEEWLEVTRSSFRCFSSVGSGSQVPISPMSTPVAPSSPLTAHHHVGQR